MNADDTRFVDILKNIFNTYGLDLLHDYGRLNALLMDLAPKNSKERKLINSVLREGIGLELAKFVDESEEAQTLCIQRCIYQIKSGTWISESVAEYAVLMLANAIGINCEVKHPQVQTRVESTSVGTGNVGKVLIKGEFAGDINNTAVSLSGYTDIGYKAFAANTVVSDVVIPESVKCIKSKAFLNCVNLKSITLSSGLENMGADVFKGCNALENISASGRKFSTVKGMLLNKDKKSIVRVENAKNIDTAQIPERIEVVERFAFENNPVKMIKIPRSLKSIAYNAFVGCTHLEKFDVDVHNAAFSSPEGVLYNRSRELLIKYPQGNKNVNYIIEDETTEIAEAAFGGALYLETITFTNSLKVIGSKAFENCIKMTSLVLPASVEVIGERAFQYCAGLASVMLPRSIKEIGDFAFQDCKAIQTLSVPPNVKRIGNAAFKGCSGLQRVVIQSGVEYIGDGAFDGCSEEMEVCVRGNEYVEEYCRARGLKVNVF